MHKSNNAVSIVIGPPESGNIDSNTKRNLDFLRDEAFSFEPGELEIDKKNEDESDGGERLQQKHPVRMNRNGKNC